jgi:FKBP-type peptidyl-prolyl cis-trans isomerase
MRKLLLTSLNVFAAGTLFVGGALAQQTPTPTTPAPAAGQSSSGSATPKTSTAAKPKTTTPGASKTPAPLVLKTQKDKFSYALGMNLGGGLHKQEVEIDPVILARGLRDAYNSGKTVITEDQARTILSAAQADFRKKAQEKQAALQAKMAIEAAANKKAGETFLAENKGKDGVIALPSGLQYKILQPGDGPKPSASDVVICNYKGTLTDGTEFDSSAKHGDSATFPVTGVIKGWTEALQLMPVGSKWQLFIPADLAYGDQSRGPQIPPGATLVFELELLSIKPKEAAPDAPPAAPGTPKTPGAAVAPAPASAPPAPAPKPN